MDLHPKGLSGPAKLSTKFSNNYFILSGPLSYFPQEMVGIGATGLAGFSISVAAMQAASSVFLQFMGTHKTEVTLSSQG